MQEGLIPAIEQRINDLLKPAHFLVEVRIKPTNNIKVFIDGDEGIALSDLIEYNRKLYRQLEENGTFPDGDFSLEVSSPGVDEPLKLHRQYRKNIGRYAEVLLADGSRHEGKLIAADEASVTLETETGKGKKKEVKQENIPFNQIKTTTIQVKF